ncbi:Membrane proteinase PrsW, cleaves anti-sigma factor RsiW, M82 family [Raineyella antarctica]|uniref:Membrane proteinase PrsW, cleaves anti-sigma factor RsiW, M82 family n=1 Tax=Raineyella antarctica TaxID=1577474 RepID=A0A1G6GCW1_9ACTN|nr:PrsW family glutamic-type intramembrane protease [Raineyella antarctica]SDB79827.1 Membrane proteinase PrsW, cleaves anti-sigma factor RsiW, M82 family [Raineyella antarctica]
MPTQDHTAASWRWILVLCAAGALYWLALLVLIATSDVRMLPIVLLLGALVFPAAVLAYLNWSTPRPVVSGVLVVGVTILSGVVGVPLSNILESFADGRTSVATTLAVAGIEESLKLLVPGLVLAAGMARDRRAGAVIGVAAGAGFAILEMLGAGVTSLPAGSALRSLDRGLLVRDVLHPACHLAWTGVVAAALWQVRDHPRPGALAALLAGFVVVVALHAAADSSPDVLFSVLVATASLALLVVAGRRTNCPDRVAA